jgi:excisionase family DNA binding protein
MVPMPSGSNGPHGALSVHTLEEAAGLLRVKQSWLERQAAARKIPFTMLGGAYHFTSAHLTEIIRIHEQLPASDADRPDHPVTRRVPRSRQAVEPSPVMPLRPRPSTKSRQVA